MASVMCCFVVTFCDRNERSVEDSMDVRGPFATFEEAVAAVEVWATESCYDEDENPCGWSGNIYWDESDGTYVWMIHELYKSEETSD